MRRLGGSISAANRKTGGAEFVLRFPVSPTPKRALRAAAKSRPSRPSPSKRRVPA
jgi:hypothetical protein